MISVSVVIPTHNRSSVLPRAVESVCNQTFGDFELLIVDDGSTDETGAVVESFTDDRIQYLELPENQGANVARNVGIDAATGRYVAFLDADDEWEPEKLQQQVELLEEVSESVGLVYTGIIQQDTDGNVTAKSPPEYEGEVLDELLQGNFIGTFSSVMVRADIFNDITLHESLPSWQDWHFYLDIAREWEIRAVDRYLVRKYADRDDQISKDFQRKFETTYPILRERLEELSAEYNPLFQRKVMASLDYHLGYSALINERYPAARRLFAHSLGAYPLQGMCLLYLLLALGGTPVYKTAQFLKRRVVT